jgi:hypothetical protein
MQSICKAWLKRNNDLHHPQDNREATGKRRHLEMKIHHLYTKEHKVLGMYRIAFSVPLAERLLQSTCDLELYIAVYRDMIVHGIKMTKVQTRHSHKLITAYFMPQNEVP